jgi:dihydroorotate dehydrogenase electron transfer subunit
MPLTASDHTTTPNIHTTDDKIFDLPLRVLENHRLTPSINVVVLDAPEIAPRCKPGQFLEIKTSEGLFPLLRRPFSVHWTDGTRLEIMSKVVGIGTDLLYKAKPGDTLQTLAPLGNTFGYTRDDVDVALLVSGGIGVAPMAELEKALTARNIPVVNFIGARNSGEIITRRLTNTHIATDDGSMGFHGNIVALLKKELPRFSGKRLRVYSCGPNPMLAALSEFCNAANLSCEVSIESTMGCGIGICYGCPVRVKDERGDVHNKLLCQYGSILDAREVVWHE